MFDWKNNEFTADYSLGSSTILPELGTFSFSSGAPDYVSDQTTLPQSTPSGGFFGDALKAVTATAETFLGGVQKIYQLDNTINSAKLQQRQIESGLELDKLKLSGSLDLNKAQIAAQRDLGVLQAEGAVAQAVARQNSSGIASYISGGSGIPTPLLLIGLGVLGYFALKGRAP